MDLIKTTTNLYLNGRFAGVIKNISAKLDKDIPTLMEYHIEFDAAQSASNTSCNNLQAAIAENLKDYSLRFKAGHTKVSCGHVVGMLSVLSQLAACK